MGLPLCRDPPASPPKTARDPTAAARSHIRRRLHRRRAARLDTDRRSSQQVLLDLLQFTQGEGRGGGNVGVGGRLSTAATTASSDVSVSSSTAGETSPAAAPGSGSAPIDRDTARDMLRHREPGDDHYEPPSIFGPGPPYNMLFPPLSSPVLRHSPSDEARHRSRSPARARESAMQRDLEREIERSMDREAHDHDYLFINPDFERRRERSGSLRSAFGPGGSGSGGRWSGWGGASFTWPREGEGVDEQSSGNGGPGRWGRVYSTRNPNPEGEEQSSYVRESARRAERAARFMESIRVHAREFGGEPASQPAPDVSRAGRGVVDGLGDRERSLSPDHSPWSPFPAPAASDFQSMDIPPQGGDLLTHCDFGSDAESEIDGPEMGSNSSRREGEGEGEPATAAPRPS
ncbi:hypothetical protein EV426DRAFT_699575 [Tirmania nivea]|nr:hypothetical protein EV426DRAFT_699575 [Tirmania nivea]